MKSFLENDDIEMHSTYNEGKPVVAERFVITLKNKICKYVTSVSKNAYIDKLNDVVNKYNNTYHSPTKMKPVDVKSNSYIGSRKKIKKIKKNILNLRLVILLEYQNIKTFLQKVTLKIDQKKIL